MCVDDEVHASLVGIAFGRFLAQVFDNVAQRDSFKGRCFLEENPIQLGADRLSTLARMDPIGGGRSAGLRELISDNGIARDL
jgi:hypothetical protein